KETVLTPGQWVRIFWDSPGQGLSLPIKAAGTGRLDVRYVAVIERWPAEATPLPQRSGDLMPWDLSDSTFLTGARAFSW
ncbi:MAG TPA: hypothetical protein VN914_21740, partial [Polyangia bacterium]|nr:hypothetical protein [Polyangia bacterium]